MLLSRGDKALQSRPCDVTNSFSLVEITIDLLKGMRRDINGTFEQISTAVEDALEKNEESTESSNKRQRNLPSTLNDIIVYSTVGHADASSTATTNQQSLCVLLIEILDNTIGEMKERFSERNISLLSAQSHLSPAKEIFLSPVDLKSFADLIECEVKDSFTRECEVANLIFYGKLTRYDMQIQLLYKKFVNFYILSEVLFHWCIIYMQLHLLSAQALLFVKLPFPHFVVS